MGIEVSGGPQPVCYPPQCTKCSEEGPASSDARAFTAKSFAVYKKTQSWRDLKQEVLLDSTDTAERIKMKLVESVSCCRSTDPGCIQLFFRCKTSLKMKGEKIADLKEIALESGKTLGNLALSENVSSTTHDLGIQVVDDGSWASESTRSSAGFQGSIFAPLPRSEVVEISQ